MIHPDNCPCESLGVAQAPNCPPTDIVGILAYLDQRIAEVRRRHVNADDAEDRQSSHIRAEALRVAKANHSGTLDALVEVRDWVATGQEYARRVAVPSVHVVVPVAREALADPMAADVVAEVAATEARLQIDRLRGPAWTDPTDAN